MVLLVPVHYRQINPPHHLGKGDGLSKEERVVTLEYKNKRIIIKKAEPENNSSTLFKQGR